MRQGWARIRSGIVWLHDASTSGHASGLVLVVGQRACEKPPAFIGKVQDPRPPVRSWAGSCRSVIAPRYDSGAGKIPCRPSAMTMSSNMSLGKRGLRTKTTGVLWSKHRTETPQSSILIPVLRGCCTQGGSENPLCGSQGQWRSARWLRMVRFAHAAASGGHTRRLRRGHRFLGKRRWDAAVQQVTDEVAELDWCETTVDRYVWAAPEMRCVRGVLRRTAPMLPLPFHRHFIQPTADAD